jgi:C-terminal processing protease CtpA/Prc
MSGRVPFQFRWIDVRMVVTSAGALPRGTEVLRIDGRPVRDILTALIPLVRADGGNDDKRRALLEVRGIDEYETFDIFYPLVFPASDRFVLDVRMPDGRRRAVTLDAIDLAERQASRPPAREDRSWTIEHRGRTAIVTMPDWAMYQTKWDWKGWIDAAVGQMASRRTSGLILDLRANEGGNDCGDEIIARLIDAPLLDDAGPRRVRFRTAPERLRPYLDTWDPSFRTLGKNGVDSGDGFLDLPPDADLTIRPKGPRFRGKVLVLTGPQNSSATFQFASRVRRAGLGKLVGGATGGNRRGINGGAYFFLRLPGGLEVDLPLIGYFPRRPEPDAGLIPDIAVADSIADIAAGRDAVLARALSLLG